MDEKETDAHRLRVALGILAANLRGNGLDSLKPISVEFANRMAEFAEDARWKVPNERLDEACRANPEA